MADYYPLIARAIAGLEKNTGEASRSLYERARTALVAQLRGVTPALEEAEITRERLSLEEAIRKVEAEAARRSRTEGAGPPAGAAGPPPPAPRYPDASPRAGEPPRPKPPIAPPARPATGQGPTPPPPGAPRQPVNPAAKPSNPPAKPPFPPPPLPQRQAAPKPPASDPGQRAPGAPRPARDPFADHPNAHDFDRLMEPRLAQEDFNREARPATASRDDGLVQTMDPFREAPPSRGARPPRDPDDEIAQERPQRAWGGIVKAALAVVLLLAIAGLVYSQRGLMSEVWQALRGSPTTVATDKPSQQQTQGRPKITDRLGAPDPKAAAGPAVAQRVVLYEEEPNDPQGKRFIGSAIWRTETVSPGPGRPPELAVRADVEIPERRMTMTFSIRRNTDQTLPASHTIEVMFNLPADFPSGGISNVPGVLMKQAEQTRGTPLAGLAVKVTNNFFLIGLSAVESDQTRNIQLLKERSWFDIPVVYNNNRRAILAIEKGTPGERAFAEAFAAWRQ